MEQNNKIKTPEPHIFLDMDGVLSDFIGGVEQLFEVDLSGLNTWDIASYMRITPALFWGKIKEEKLFWGKLKPYPWAREVVNVCLEATRGRVTISTSPALDPNCAGQKAWWISHWFPGLNRAFLIGPQKHLLAGPNRVLIDDSPHNCQDFVQAGGQTIVFPQPWNAGLSLLEPGESREAYVKRMLDNFVHIINEEDGDGDEANDS